MTLNMSGSGILLTTDRVLFPGSRLEMEIKWPVEREKSVPQNLLIMGQVVRSEKSVVALAGVKIRRYTFHTVSPEDRR
jgi:hypothetical protein